MPSNETPNNLPVLPANCTECRYYDVRFDENIRIRFVCGRNTSIEVNGGHVPENCPLRGGENMPRSRNTEDDRATYAPVIEPLTQMPAPLGEGSVPEARTVRFHRFVEPVVSTGERSQSDSSDCSGFTYQSAYTGSVSDGRDVEDIRSALHNSLECLRRNPPVLPNLEWDWPSPLTPRTNNANPTPLVKYSKVKFAYKKDRSTGKALRHRWADETISYLADGEWEWTEKVKGLHLTVYWDGENVGISTTNPYVKIPTKLDEKLKQVFTEKMLKGVFGSSDAHLFGVGCGEGIANTEVYTTEGNPMFVLFDVYTGKQYAPHSEVVRYAGELQVDVTPTLGSGSLDDAIEKLKGRPCSRLGTTHVVDEIVCRPFIELKNAKGSRVIVKMELGDLV